MVIAINVAEIPIAFQLPYELKIEDRFLPFMSEESGKDIRIRLDEVDELPAFEIGPDYSENNYKIYSQEDGTQWRSFYWRNNHNLYYATARIGQNDQENIIYYLKDGMTHLNHLNGLMYHISWEQLLLDADRMIFHAACIASEYGGLLFSGPSGIGKSTQADLWCSYEDAELINGDRPIVGKRNDTWVAYGSPYAGSSNCYKNKKVPIRAIVMLEQATECFIERLPLTKGFRKVLEQMTVNQWNRKSMLKASELTSELITDIPVYQMRCTPDQNAIACLKRVLMEDTQSGCK